MEGYLGEEIITDLTGTPFEHYTVRKWALYMVSCGQCDGSHHKAWALDQVARVLNGTPVIVSLAKWANGHEEYRVTLGEPSEAYKNWVKVMRGKWDDGIAP